ncbi:fumarate hydratase C-terminal domain-containing protein [Treponema zioleckii]|uniref:fumarate hydratase C-terminal domain-containing protein n=1 Tax=Treponema zioleckii TaxID=331680 RepID=UPI00168B5402|nr:fumarate hydratase C-terminal domain-containing protein [Treponema zioleckii]
MKKIFDDSDFDFYPFEDGDILKKTAEDGFERLSFTFTKEHLENVIKAALSPSASENDKYVCSCILKNAQVSSEKKFPLCQDTGIANIFGWKKGNFFAPNEYESLSAGAKKIYDEKKLRFSTSCPKSFYDEFDPKNNMPAQVSIFSATGSLAPVPSFIEDLPQDSMGFIFCAKGGGSSNKTSFIQGTKAYLTKERFTKLMKDEISHFGTSACPPYTIAIVAGGLSPEQNLLTLKLATCGAYDKMTYEPNEFGFRDRELEEEAMKIARETGFGAQFGGSAFALEAIVIRLPRHGASCPISFGVSCSAHRNLKAVVTKTGFYLQKTVENPSELKDFKKASSYAEQNGSPNGKCLKINTENGIDSVLKTLEGSLPGDRIELSGKILVARDAAHARWKKMIDESGTLLDYATKYPICYAGPARTPDGEVIGSFGPTTAGRMDVYAELLMSRGAALVTLAKGNRSNEWTDSCKKFGGFYLGTPGGIAALIASKYIVSQEIIDYEDLGMEAVRLVTVKKLPCFVITNNKGEDFYKQIAESN